MDHDVGDRNGRPAPGGCRTDDTGRRGRRAVAAAGSDDTGVSGNLHRQRIGVGERAIGGAGAHPAAATPIPRSNVAADRAGQHRRRTGARRLDQPVRHRAVDCRIGLPGAAGARRGNRGWFRAPAHLQRPARGDHPGRRHPGQRSSQPDGAEPERPGDRLVPARRCGQQPLSVDDACECGADQFCVDHRGSRRGRGDANRGDDPVVVSCWPGSK